MQSDENMATTYQQLAYAVCVKYVRMHACNEYPLPHTSGKAFERVLCNTIWHLQMC